jgi:hypothetical protein
LLLSCGYGCKVKDCRWRGTTFEALADHISTLQGAKDRSINLQIIDSWHMDSLVPQPHRLWHQAVIGGVDIPGCAPPLHDHLQRATHAHQQHWQTLQKLRTSGEDSPWNSIGVVVSDIHYDIESQAAVQSNRCIHGAIQDHNERLQVRAFTPRP